MTVSIHGFDFEVMAEPADFWGWIAEGRYDDAWRLLDKYLRPEHTFVDLGSWVGSHSLYASSVAHRVISVEPDPIAFCTLAQNLAMNHLPAPYQLAITDQSGRVRLGSGKLGWSTTRVNPAAGGGIGAWEPGEDCEVPTTTLKNLVERQLLTDPLFIKIDVEGSEEQILRDLSWFAEHRPTILLELHPWWWKDEQAVWLQVNELAKIYGVGNVLHAHALTPIAEGSVFPREVLFV